MIPDFITALSEITAGKGFEIEPGIQFGGGVSGVVGQGGTVYINLILQNALDAPVKANIKVTVPERTGLRKTNLRTVEGTEVSLDAYEAEKILIPIQTSRDTPEGDYRIEINIKGSGGKGGNRIRDGLKKVEGRRLAPGQSVAASAALSAIGLFLGGRITVATYTKSDRIGLNIKVSGSSVSSSSPDLIAFHQKLWKKSYAEIDSKLASYLEEMLKACSVDSSIKGYVASSLVDSYRNLFNSVGFPITDEELVWIGQLMVRLIFDVRVGGFYTIDVSIPLIENVERIMEGKREYETKPLKEYLDFKQDILNVWLKYVQETENLKFLFSRWAAYRTLVNIASIRALPVEKTRELIQQKTPEVRNLYINSFKAYKDHKDNDGTLRSGVTTLLGMGILESKYFFENEQERRVHLKALRELIAQMPDPEIGEGRKKGMLKNIDGCLT